MANSPIQAETQPEANIKLVTAYKIMLNIVADWEQSEYSESINGNSGCQTAEHQLNDPADPKSDERTQEG